MSQKLNDTEKTQRQQLLDDLYSDSESTTCTKKSNISHMKSVPNKDLEDGEIVEDVKKPSEIENEIVKDGKGQEKGKKMSRDVKAAKARKKSPIVEKPVTKVRTPSSRKAVADKKSVSKIVPGTVDDSACDLGEMIQKQTSLVQKEEAPLEQEKETVGVTAESTQGDFEIEKLAKSPKDILIQVEKTVAMEKEIPVETERLIELSDLTTSEETFSQKTVSPCSLIGQRSMESIIMQNQELFGDQSNISLLIAADIFLQNENTVKNGTEQNTDVFVENGEVTPKNQEKSKVTPDSSPESQFQGFNSQEIQSSPRNNSNDSLKENICTPITNQSQNVCPNPSSTPRTTTKSEPKQLLTQLNNGPDSSIPTPDTSKDVTEEQIASNTMENTSKGDDSLNSSAKRKVIETKSTQYVVEETDDMVICTVNRKKWKKEKKEKKSKHKHKHKDRTPVEEKL